MAAPDTSRTGGGKGTLAAPLAALMVLAGALSVAEDDRSTPYKDSAGIWTVCRGVTGPAVIPGKRYTPEECAVLNNAAMHKHTDGIARCINRPLQWYEWVAWGHFTYNVGVAGFCNSTAARHLRDGNSEAACAQIPSWRFITINGVKRDCRNRSWNCYGIVNRREWEMSMCRGDIPASNYPDIEAWLKEPA